MPAKHTKPIKVPQALAARLERLRDAMERAYTEGRINVPTQLCQHIPTWYVIQSALDEVEARRVRSNRPRRRIGLQEPANGQAR
jgi:hypothetical protein